MTSYYREIEILLHTQVDMTENTTLGNYVDLSDHDVDLLKNYVDLPDIKLTSLWQLGT